MAVIHDFPRSAGSGINTRLSYCRAESGIKTKAYEKTWIKRECLLIFSDTTGFTMQELA